MFVSDGVQAFVEATMELQMGDETRAPHNFYGVSLFFSPHGVAISYTHKANKSETFKDWLALVIVQISGCRGYFSHSIPSCQILKEAYFVDWPSPLVLQLEPMKMA